jgi:voltage-gated potassium channel
MTARVRIILACVLLTGVALAGAVGFMLVEGWSFGDSLYMAVITVSTVGYGEVRPLSSAGRVLAVAVIVVAVGALGFSATSIGVYLAEGHLLHDLRRKRMERALRRLHDHYIICGGGLFGREVAAEFARSQAPYAVVDVDPDECDLGDLPGLPFVKGDAGDDQALREAGVERAKGLVAALPEDDANLYVVLTARQLNPALTIITKAVEQRSIDKLRLAGADRVVSPYLIAGRAMASALLRPSVVNFLDEALYRETTPLQIEQLPIPADSPVVGQSITAAGIGAATGATVVAIHRADGSLVTTAEALTATLRGGDILVAVGTDEQLAALTGLVG